jgi:hypothetical protein
MIGHNQKEGEEMRVRRIGISVSALLLAMVLGGLPAGASGDTDSGLLITGDYVEFSDQVPGRNIQVSVRATGVLRNLNTLQVVVECDVRGAPDPQRAVVEECTVTNEHGDSVSAAPLSFPGAAAATAGTGIVRLSPLTACVTGSVNFGPLFPETLRISECTTGAGQIGIDDIVDGIEIQQG